eukprot:CAMPEP_0116026388 /NCGR_PEP_ID=MMETSP0321-20121206/13803_1 /TAXON_ID=163516 /ORGANISM="Leptocylindrus danicus var. danicus, Strain B650" /LENGTH=201 /DNA_ID=CAMNT_0003499141 /DNA_START=1 /DNA_END=603 /DNA_ORIENTATION=-
MSNEQQTVELYGGAMICEIPTTWRDVSEVRQVPDHQCVFQDCVENTDSLLVLEILERQESIRDADAATFFFEDLADSNGAVTCEQRRIVQSNVFALGGIVVPRLKPQCTICTCIGVQRVILGRERNDSESKSKAEFRYIAVELCVIRMGHVGTDFLISLSRPVSSEVFQKYMQTGSTTGVEDEKYSDEFGAILKSFQVRDW